MYYKSLVNYVSKNRYPFFIVFIITLTIGSVYLSRTSSVTYQCYTVPDVNNQLWCKKYKIVGATKTFFSQTLGACPPPPPLYRCP